MKNEVIGFRTGIYEIHEVKENEWEMNVLQSTQRLQSLSAGN